MLHALLTKLSSTALLGWRPALLSSARGGEVNAVLQFEQLVGDTHFAVLQSATVASLVNALQAGHLQDPFALRDLAPQLPRTTAKLARRARGEIGVAAETTTAVQTFFAELRPALKLVEAFCADTKQYGVEEASFLHLVHLSERWQLVILRALKAVDALHADVVRCLPQRYSQNTPMLKQLLRAALRGHEPAFDGEGHPTLPELPQRRASLRPNVSLPCVLEHQGKTSRAIVTDISTGGLGLDRAPELTPQSVILVEFDNGACIAGLVVWSKGARAGVKFDAPLKANHPLLATDEA